MNKPKFIAKSTTVSVPALRGNTAAHSVANCAVSVNLDDLGVHSLIGELTAKYNQNNDVGIIRSWFRRKKVEAQDKHLQALSNLVQSLRSQSSDLLEFKAKLMTQREVLFCRMTEIIEASQFAVDRQREEHLTFLSKEKASRNEVEIMLERERLHNETIEAKNKKIFGEAQQDLQRANILALRGKLIEKITEELDFADINMKQVFVLIEMIKDTNNKEDVLTLEAQWENLKADAEKKQAQADQENLTTEQKRWKFDQDREFDEKI